MTFAEWLANQTSNRWSGTGDIAREVAADPCFRADSLTEALQHLDNHGASDAARDAVRQAWAEFEAAGGTVTR